MSLRRSYIYSVLVTSMLVFMFISCEDKSGAGTGNIVPPPDNGNSSTCSKSGGGSCVGNSNCEEQCEDLFSGNTKTNACKDFSVDEVQGIFSAFDEKRGLLEGPSEDDLKDISCADIKNALSIDKNIWSKLARTYNSSQSKRVLYWIATENDIYGAIETSLEDNDLKSLFEELSGTTFTDLIIRNLDEDAEDNFIVLAVANKGLRAAQFVLENAEEDCPKGPYSSAGDFTEAACLLGQVFCKKDGRDYIFEAAFEFIIKNTSDLKDFVEDGRSDGYADGLDVEDSDDISTVCEAAEDQGLPE